MNEENRKLYDARWATWEDLKITGAAARHTRRIIFSMLKKIEFRSVLDVGCGSGLLLEAIQHHYPSVALSGTEFSPKALEMARKRLSDGQFYQLDLSKEKLPSQYDLVLCIDVLEHIEADQEAMRNLRQMTERWLLAAVPLGPILERERTEIGHVQAYSRSQFEKRITDAGFQIVESRQWGFPFFNLFRRFSQRGKSVHSSSDLISPRQKLLFELLYWIYFINLPFGGERLFVLCRAA